MKLKDVAARSSGPNKHTFEVEIKNLGIPLKNVQVALRGFYQGTITLLLEQLLFDEVVPPGGSLEKGMMAKFALRQIDFDKTRLACLAAFNQPETSNIDICVASNGSVVKFFRLDRRWESIRQKWNDFASRLNQKLSTVKYQKGKPYIKTNDWVPVFSDRHFQLKLFIQYVTTPLDDFPKPPMIQPQGILASAGAKLAPAPPVTPTP